MMKKRLIFLVLLGLLVMPTAYGQDPPPEEPPAQPERDPGAPQQVSVSAKVVEFQATRGVDTGLSAYFRRRSKTDWWGVVRHPTRGIMTGDITFPTGPAAALTVFLDRIRMSEGDIEVVLQALVNENRASILSRPRVMCMVGAPVPTRIQTAQRVPYENTTVVGVTTVHSTEFRDTGVTLEIQALDVVDFDGDWNTTDDTFIRLQVNVDVSEEGQRIVVALDDKLVGGEFGLSTNAITAPEFIKRSVNTQVWVRHGQVLMLGGLYRNTSSKSLATLPWLTQAEDMAVGLAGRAVQSDLLGSPLSATVGNRSTEESRRELVFFIKAEAWRPAYTLADTHGFMQFDDGEEQQRRRPTDLITDVLGGISDIPRDIGEGIRGRGAEGSGIQSELGGGR